MPEGSHLDPILFLFFVNDIVNVFRFAKCLMYLHHLKLFTLIKHSNDAVDLQKDLRNSYGVIKYKKFKSIKFKSSTIDIKEET